MSDLWHTPDANAWRAALGSYERVIDAQGVASLPAHDHWYRETLGVAIAQRDPMHLTHAELVRVTEWKMARGVWRARNLVLVRGNDPAVVERTSAEALATIPHPTKPIALLAELAGVGPATASAVVSAAAPEMYPFLDELVAAQVPDLGPVKFTHRYYGRYADALRARAASLGGDWTPVSVERALWAFVGGKAGAR